MNIWQWLGKAGAEAEKVDKKLILAAAVDKQEIQVWLGFLTRHEFFIQH